MLRLIKKLGKLFKPIDKVSLSASCSNNQYSELINTLRTYARNESLLLRTLNDPVNKLYLVNTYTVSFDDLLRNIAYKDFNRKINAVNCYSYFKVGLGNLSITLDRIATMLEQGLKLSSMIEHDLYEITNTWDYLSK